ncbi:MAG: VCBS repeat-containing protein [Bacteroidetes bacterium]|nr:VCBS repeat-containing protein [Bacteroidota bacterium]
MKKTLLICFLFLAMFCKAQINFLNHNIIDNSFCIGSVNNVIPLDIDNDGDLDIISSSDTNYIVWQENLDGQGNYGNIHIISDQLNGITSISLSDIDQDSDMDIVSSSRNVVSGSGTYGAIAWHENIGQGHFTSHVLMENLTGAYYAKAADMDGDGDLDITANTNLGNLAWFKNTNGLGNFSTPFPIASSGLALVTSFDIGDADGDGDNDVVVTSSLIDQYMKVGLFINTNGQGTFGPFQLLRNEAPEINYSIVTRVLFQDLDADGDKDILFSANNKLIRLTNSGTGSFLTANIIYSSSTSDRFIDFNLKDMDNDGNLDIVAALRIWQNFDKVIWFKNNSAHTYTTNYVIQNFTVDYIQTFKIADLDGDNVNDIVTGNSMDNFLVWYKNYTTIKALGKNCYDPFEVKTADLDNDGDVDIITSVNNGNKLVWYENTDGAGSTGLQKVITFSDPCFGYELGDIDGNGSIDIAMDGKWYKNDGHGNFSPNTYLDEYSDNTSTVFIKDVDNDGSNDLIAVDNLSNGNAVIGWYRNLNGLGSFGPRQSILFVSGISINKIEFADMDGDGDKDIVFSGGKIGIVKNINGTGTFETTFQTVYSYTAGPLFCVDMDADGDKDILTSEINMNSDYVVAWFKNSNGLGTFSSSPQVVNYSSLSGVFPADMDNDGDLDILSNERYDKNTLWLENLNGLGVFGQPITLLVNAETNTSNNAADVDNDGKIDILYSTTYAGNNAVSWFKNNGLSLNKISGTVKLDLNHNGCDSADNPMPNVKVMTQTSSNNTYSTFTSSNGYYQIYVEEPGNYTTSVATTLPSYFTVSPNSQNTNFVGINNVQAVNFCIADNQTVNDLDVAIYPYIEARPGFTNSYVIVYHNKGTTILSGNVKLQFDATKLSFSASNPVVSSQIANELTYNFINMNPFETKMIRVVFQTFAPPIVNLGDVLSFTGTINPIADDATPADNIFQLNQTVIGSYDPNDINVLEGENISVDEIDNYLHYVIRFQNTGTASAINVTVTNTLDNNLDWDTLQIDGISHNNYISIRNGNQISFVFKGIYLPYSSANEPGSHGFICYKIKPKNNTILGDLFHNDAQIYFDYNSAIQTNTVVTEVLNPLSNQDFGNNNKATLYPNPTNGKIYIAVNFDIASLAVYNVYGQKIAACKNNTEIDLSGYNVGMYFIRIVDTAGKIIIKKILKK